MCEFVCSTRSCQFNQNKSNQILNSKKKKFFEYIIFSIQKAFFIVNKKLPPIHYKQGIKLYSHSNYALRKG